MTVQRQRQPKSVGINTLRRKSEIEAKYFRFHSKVAISDLALEHSKRLKTAKSYLRTDPCEKAFE